MNELIYRQAAIDALKEPCKVPDTWTDEYAVGERMQWEKDVKALNNLPSAEPKRKTGKWLDGNRTGYGLTLYWYIYCSECLWERDDDNHDKDTPYCPICGAKMEVNDGTD